MNRIGSKTEKKLFVSSITGILILILIVGSFSYAMFSFIGTGTKENVIVTGTLTVSYDETSSINLVGQYPMSDSLGISQNVSECSINSGTNTTKTLCDQVGGTWYNSTLNFNVTATISGATMIYYAIGITDVVEGSTLTDDYVKIYLTKDGVVAAGFTPNTGKDISDFYAYKATDEINHYAIVTDSFATSGTHSYTLKAWVDENYNLPSTTTGQGTDTIIGSTASETFSFKIKLIAKDSIINMTNDEVAPAIQDVVVEKYGTEWTTVAENTLLNSGDQIRITTIYDEEITGTVPTLGITFGETAAGEATAGNVSTDRISYTYTVQNNDFGTLGIELTGTGLTDVAGNSANYTLSNALSDYVSSIAKIETEKNYSYSTSADYYLFEVLKSGYYYVELNGSAGRQPSGASAGGSGGKTSGYIYMNKGEKYYIYVGGMGAESTGTRAASAGGYNGGGDGGFGSSSNLQGGSGGGATDIRYFGNTTPTAMELESDSTLGLNSRIMVAGAGGGGASGTAAVPGGAGGGLNGTKAVDYSASVLSGGYGGTQVSGGAAATYVGSQYDTVPTAGSFGIGGNGGYGWPTTSSIAGAGAAGAGYYGGGGGARWHGGGGGGSSYISGYLGSVAISKYLADETTTNNTSTRLTRLASDGQTRCTSSSAASDITCSYHYSNKKFVNGAMTSGTNTGNGSATIEWIGTELAPTCTIVGPYTTSALSTKMVYTKSGGGTGYNPYYQVSCSSSGNSTISSSMSESELQAAITTTTGLTISSVSKNSTSTTAIYNIMATPNSGSYGNKSITIPAGMITSSSGLSNSSVTSSTVDVVYGVTGSSANNTFNGTPNSGRFSCSTSSYNVNTTSGQLSISTTYSVYIGTTGSGYSGDVYYGCLYSGGCATATATLWSGTWAAGATKTTTVSFTPYSIPTNGTNYSCLISSNDSSWAQGTSGTIFTVYR